MVIREGERWPEISGTKSCPFSGEEAGRGATKAGRERESEAVLGRIGNAKKANSKNCSDGAGSELGGECFLRWEEKPFSSTSEGRLGRGRLGGRQEESIKNHGGKKSDRIGRKEHRKLMPQESVEKEGSRKGG